MEATTIHTAEVAWQELTGFPGKGEVKSPLTLIRRRSSIMSLTANTSPRAAFTQPERIAFFPDTRM